MAKYTTIYDKNQNYQQLINDAVENKDYQSAAVYEQQRNAKISGEGITDYNQTHDWEKFLPKEQTQPDNTPYIKAADNAYAKYTQQADQFDALLNGLQDKMQNREAFSYDPESDPMYGVYRDIYTKNGQNAMNDTLAQISARTGGLASSYAGQAAQGAYNRYMDQLNAAVPELRNLAYQMYRDQIGDDVDMFGMISNRQGRADNLGQNAWDNSYRERNMQADNDWNMMQWNYQTGNDAMDRARGEIDAYLSAGGSAAGIPADLLQAAGYSNAYLAAMENAYAQKNARKTAGGDSGEEKSGNDDENTTDDAISMAGSTDITDIKKLGTAQGDGALRWNGRNYPISDYGFNALITDINNANLSDAEMNSIINRLKYLGFNAG